jgi:hypothetical protein
VDDLAELVGDDGRYYATDEPPLQQGDIVLAPVVRLQTDAAAIERWQSFDQASSDQLRVAPDLPAFLARVGYGWAMVVTHDCHLDREFNERVKTLRRTEKLKLREAEEAAEADPDLDRFINVCPLIPAAAYRADWDTLARGEPIGTFPVPALPARGVDDLVVDLTYRATIDRHTVVARAAALSEQTRTWLRFSLARTDVFRTPQIGFELEQAVGKRITAITAHSSNPLMVGLELSDGSTLELAHQPAEVGQGGTSRKRSPGDA